MRTLTVSTKDPLGKMIPVVIRKRMDTVRDQGGRNGIAFMSTADFAVTGKKNFSLPRNVQYRVLLNILHRILLKKQQNVVKKYRKIMKNIFHGQLNVNRCSFL